MNKLAKFDITCVILAGGQARRMNKQDKGLIVFNNQPLITYTINTVRKYVAKTLISANRNQEKYQAFGTVIIDDLPDFQGPLAGIAKALEKANTEYLLVLPCDNPFINVILMNRLFEAMAQKNVDICVADDGLRVHPAIALLKTSLKHNLLDFLDTGGRKLGLWIKQNNFIKVDLSDYQEVFINLNQPEDFKNFK